MEGCVNIKALQGVVIFFAFSLTEFKKYLKGIYSFLSKNQGQGVVLL